MAFAVDPDSIQKVKDDPNLQLLEGPSLAIEYLKPARLDDNLAVSVHLDSLGKVRCTFAQEVKREDDVLVKARVNVACLSDGGLKPVEIPEALRKKMEAAL